MPIYPGSTTNITLYPTTPTELNIALYPAPTPAGGIALVQSASGTTADGSAGLIVPFGAAVVTAAGTGQGTYTYTGQHNGRPYFNISGTDPEFSSISYNARWRLFDGAGLAYRTTVNSNLLPWETATWTDQGGGLPVPIINCSAPVTAGNSVIALISFDSAGGFDEQPTLIGGGAEQILNFNPVINGGIYVNQAYVHNVAGGSTGASFTLDAAVRANNLIAEYSGLADAAAEDTATSTATSTTLAIGTITPTSANNLLTAIFAFNADVTAVGIANDVLVSGAGTAAANGIYVYRGVDGNGNPFWTLTGTNPLVSAISYSTGAELWVMWAANGDNLYISAGNVLPFPWQDTPWSIGDFGVANAPTVTEIPGWELVGTRTGGSSVWEYVYARVQSTATPQNPTIVLSGSCDIAGAAAVFGGT